MISNAKQNSKELPDAPTPSARDYIESAWWIVTMPGLSILISVLVINLLGDGLRDALDPKLKRMA